MQQSVKDQKNQPVKQGRPGQRQQERLQRIARRRRRTQIWFSSVVSVLLIAAAVVAILEYQRYTADQAAAATSLADKHTTATAVAGATQTAASITPTPSAGPATPPPVSGTLLSQAGVQYIDIQQGSGPAAQAGSKVSVEYTGWFQNNGKKFDSSYDHGGQPFSVTLGQGQVIPGWDKGLIGVKAGGVRRLIIPPALAYGVAGQPPTIPANSTLIFDVTVISIQ
jgi:FKBP-type peptidyl-prolyl cis-trans isomerase